MFETFVFVGIICIAGFFVRWWPIGCEDILALLTEKKAIRAESRRLRAMYAEQENEDG